VPHSLMDIAMVSAFMGENCEWLVPLFRRPGDVSLLHSLGTLACSPQVGARPELGQPPPEVTPLT